MILKKRFRNFYERFISLQGEPAQVAAGLAIGVFVGVTPTIPFHTAIIVLLCLLFRQNITAAYLGSLIISNPLTVPLFYLSQYELSQLVLEMKLADSFWQNQPVKEGSLMVTYVSGRLTTCVSR